MRIAVDISPLSHPVTGIGNYLRGMVGGLAAAGGDRHEVVGFAPTSLRGPARIRAALGDVETRLWPLPWSHAARTAWSRIGHPAAERVLGSFDALVFSDWMYPPQRSGVRATVIHDLVPVHRPEWCTARTISMHTRKYENAARTCDVIFANSHYTADDVEVTLGVARDRIVVARPGIGERFSPDGLRFDPGRPYVLGVGTFEPRKNLPALVEAWRLLGAEYALVLAGGAGWGGEEAPEDEGVITLGYVSDQELPALYRGAAVFAYPALLEGFGMPIVEAMACGTAVVSSSHPSLDEASGDAALRADPDDPDALATALREAIGRRDELGRRGIEHAATFSWTRTAAVMLEALEARA
jgi:glycosyltransferase involved in cell wall biosynthesis